MSADSNKNDDESQGTSTSNLTTLRRQRLDLHKDDHIFTVPNPPKIARRDMSSPREMTRK